LFQTAVPTITEAIAEGARQLHVSAVGEERRTAGVLLCHALGVERTHLFTGSENQVGESDYETYLQLIERRAAGEPLQYITGHQEFYGLDFMVTPDVLIPRPETEFLVERVIKLVEESTEETPLVVDVGTGSGCIAVAVAVHFARARVLATDLSHAALDVAWQNACKHGVADRVEFLEGDLLEPLVLRSLKGQIDFIVSNPPYIPAADLEHLQREIREHEPRVALFGGDDGLDFYRRLLRESPRFLKPAGKLVIEIGVSQLPAIRQAVDLSGCQLLEVTNNLQSIPRTLTIQPRKRC
jgi:release factor glutamine methyltransferase